MAASLKNLARSPLAHRIVSSLFANGVRVVLQAGTGLILARALGVSALGTYAWAMAISAILVVPAQFGTSTLLMKEGAAAKASGDQPRLKLLWVWTLKITTLASLVSIAALLAIVYFAQASFAALDWPVFILAMAVVPFAVLINLGEAALSLDWCAAMCLPLDQSFETLVGFTGRWAGEFVTEDVALFSGAYLRENVSGRTSHDTPPILFAKGAGTTETAGPAAGFHLGWSGNHRLRVDRGLGERGCIGDDAVEDVLGRIGVN